MVKIKSETERGCRLSIYTHDGFFYVTIEDRETGYTGEPQKFNTIEEANKQFDISLEAIRGLV